MSLSVAYHHLIKWAHESLHADRRENLDGETLTDHPDSPRYQARLMMQTFCKLKDGCLLLHRGHGGKKRYKRVFVELAELCDDMMSRIDTEVRRAAPESDWKRAGLRIVDDSVDRLNTIKSSL